MKKIRLFSTTKVIEEDDDELYVNFYLVLEREYIFTFLIDSPNLACSNRNPIKLWKHFLILLEGEYVKYMRSYERLMFGEHYFRKVSEILNHEPEPYEPESKEVEE